MGLFLRGNLNRTLLAITVLLCNLSHLSLGIQLNIDDEGRSYCLESDCLVTDCDLVSFHQGRYETGCRGFDGILYRRSTGRHSR